MNSNSVRSLQRLASSASRAFSSGARPQQSASTSTAPPTATATATATGTGSSSRTHYLVTLLRSPLHLPAPLAATCNSLGLSHRLSSSLVPISRENAGFLLRVKELVAVRTVAAGDLGKAATREWRERPGEGRQGTGLVGRSDGGVIRIGSERARGEERGFKLVSRA